MLTASSQATGDTSGTSKIGSGIATMDVTGSFAAALDLTYLLEIDSVAGGVSVGQATFRWRTSDNSVGAWEETGVLTRTTPAYTLSADGLGGALSVAHTGGVGSDFALADSWQWHANATYGPERLLDRNRMTAWKSTGDTSENIVIDLGSATQATVLILHGHNFTSGATITLEGNATDSWGSPSYTSTFSTITDPLVLYLDQTYRYFRIAMADAANPDGVLTIANLFLGTYLELNKIHADWGSSSTPGAVLQSNTSEAAVMRRYYYAEQQNLTLEMGDTVTNADVDSISAIQTALINASTKRVLPMWVHLFSDVDSSMKLMDWVNLGKWSHTYFRYLLNSGITFDLAEVVDV